MMLMLGQEQHQPTESCLLKGMKLGNKLFVFCGNPLRHETLKIFSKGFRSTGRKMEDKVSPLKCADDFVFLLAICRGVKYGTLGCRAKIPQETKDMMRPMIMVVAVVIILLLLLMRYSLLFLGFPTMDGIGMVIAAAESILIERYPMCSGWLFA